MELLRALAVLAEPPQPAHRAVREALGIAEEPDSASHTDLFTFALHPYGSVWLNADGLLGGEARDRVAGFWRVLQLVPPAEPDHLCVLLALYANLREREILEDDETRRAMWGRSRRALLWEHVSPWAFAFLGKAREIASPFYREWAALTYDALAAEARDLAPTELLPLHLRALPPMADPRDDGADAFLAALLAPARSGLVLAFADLRRAADDLGLGLRAGERRYILRALFGQDVKASLGWLADAARAWSSRHRAMRDVPHVIREFWAMRSERTAELLASLHLEATTPAATSGPLR